MKIVSVSLLLLLLSVFFVNNVLAVPVHVDFTGYFNQTTDGIITNSTFDGYLDYDPDTVYYGEFGYPPMTLANFVLNSHYSDDYSINSFGNIEFLLLDILTTSYFGLLNDMYIFCNDYTYGIVHEPTLYLTKSGISITGYVGDFYHGARYDGVFDTIQFTTQPVPEPSTILFLGAGLVCLAAYSRRRIKK